MAFLIEEKYRTPPASSGDVSAVISPTANVTSLDPIHEGTNHAPEIVGKRRRDNLPANGVQLDDITDTLLFLSLVAASQRQ
jgi:hypothetical protein